MTRPSPLDDPANFQFAWARYKRMMKLMGLFSLAVVAVVLGGMYLVVGFVSIHFYIASALGIGLMIMLTAALMGLVFLSHGTGHDDSIEDPFADEERP